jgi:cysteine-rich repeat protein
MEERKLNVYSVIILVLGLFLFFLFSLFVNFKIHGYSSEGEVPSSVRIGAIVLSLCGNGTIESPYEACDDNNTNNGDGCSSTCQIESGWTCTGQPSVCTKTPPQPPQPPTPPGPPGPSGINIRIDPTEIKRNMLINSNIEVNIGITNLDKKSFVNFSVSSFGFDPDLIVNFWDNKRKIWVQSFNLNLSAGGIEELRVRFSAPSDVGLYNGTLSIDGKRVNVTLNVQEKLLLFDSNIIVLNPDYLVPQGDKLRTSVTLIPLGDKQRMDVTLNYFIKDYNNTVYLTRSETVLVENQVNFKRNFDTGVLPIGPYIINLELIYSNGVAPSSAHFEVTSGRQSTFFGKIVFFLINSILIILIIIILLVILRIIKRVIENNKNKEREERMKKWASGEKEKPKEKEDSKESEKSKEKGNSKK